MSKRKRAPREPVRPAPPAAAAPHMPSRRRWPWLVAAAASVAVAAFALVAYLGHERPASPRVAKPAAAPPAATFVGTATCSGCHASEGGAWRGSDHDLAMQRADATSVLGDFANAHFTGAGTTTTFLTRDGKYFVDTEGPDGKRGEFEVKYTFGVRPLQQYLIEMPGGRLQAFGVAWDSRPKASGGQRWFHLYPGRKLAPGDPLHWTGIDQNWNFQCAECHSTDLRKNFDAAQGVFHTTWAEINVGCEACHGPGSNHVAWARAPDRSATDARKGLPVALDERKGVTWQRAPDATTARRSVPRTTTREIDVCGRCHARAGRFADDDASTASFADTHRRATLTDELYYPDGQMRDEVYNWGSFLQSRMYAQGVTCSDCHEPHSLKLRAAGNAVCAQCHLASAFDRSTHTRHAPGSAGGQCVSCHMPTTTYMVVDPRHDHSLRIPRPDLTVTLGVPNACNACHRDKSPQWAAQAALRLWGERAREGYQSFAAAFAGAAAGAPGTRGKLLALVDDRSQPALVRASALERLVAWMTPTTSEAAVRALDDPDPVVRTAAVTALAGADAAVRERALPRMLRDPARVVRMEAANVLAGPDESALTPQARRDFAKALDEYIAAQIYNADRPESRVNLGNLQARRGEAERAIVEYRKAIAVDPTFVPAYANLADLQRSRGMDNAAEVVLREGIARNPAAAALHYGLGLTLVRSKRAKEALAEFALATRLAPADARFAYVQAIALNDTGEPAKALAALETAHRLHPYDRDVLEALATYAARDRRTAAAIEYAKTLRDLDPENPRYAQLLRQVSAPRLHK
ncbi:MAG: hypothetical protein IT516_16505 [Burkholderiales bacterium]|nr:hypothetical protein [Burkholderiales bacterium]